MNTFRKLLQLAPLGLAVSCGLSQPYQHQSLSFSKERNASFFIVDDAKVSSWDQAKLMCPAICSEEGAAWSGGWSNQSPMTQARGTCECAQATVCPPPSSVPLPAMSMEEMQTAFDVPSSAGTQEAVPPKSANAEATAVKPKPSAKPSTQVITTASAGDDVSATVIRDKATGTVTATATAGRAKAVARSSSAGTVSAGVDRSNGSITATASAGEAVAVARAPKASPFDL